MAQEAAQKTQRHADTPWAERLDAEQTRLTGLRAPLIVLVAGAGSGKTEALIARTVNLVMDGTEPERIAMVTFTRRAAQSFRRRVIEAIESLGPNARRREALERLREALKTSETMEPPAVDAPQRPWIGTFHEMCGRILRTTPAQIGWPDEIRTVGPEEAFERARAAMRAAQQRSGGHIAEEALERSTRQLLRAMSERKKAGVRSEHGMERGKLVPGVTFKPLSGEWAQAAAHIDWKARMTGSADYDDLVCEAWRLIWSDEHARDGWRRRFDHIMIDEAQDCDAMLVEMVAAIAGAAEILVAGDPDQRIYGWARAVRSFEEIEERLQIGAGDTVRVTLYNDYRGCRTIQKATTALKQHMRDPGPIAREAEEQGWGPAQFVHYERQEHQDTGLAKRIEYVLEGPAGEANEKEGKSHYDDCLVLGRTHDACASAAKALTEAGIPTWLDAGRGPRGPSACMAAWLIAAATGEDAALEAAFALGDPPVKGHALERARKTNHRLAERLRDEKVRARLSERVRERAEDWDRIAKAAGLPEDVNAHATLKAIADTIARRAIRDTRHEQTYNQDMQLAHAAIARGASLQALAQAFSERTREGSGEGRAPEGHVQVRTMHATKGLEARHVFAIGWVEGEFPTGYSRDIEEERRLAFTTISRARRTFEALGYRIGHDASAHDPSRFAHEAGLAVVEQKS